MGQSCTDVAIVTQYIPLNETQLYRDRFRTPLRVHMAREGWLAFPKVTS